MRKIYLLLTLAFAAGSVMAQDQPDPAVIQKIKDEAFNHSQVMNIAFHLTDASGPRLTNSPAFFRAAEWVRSALAGYGLQHTALEPWGDFGNGWELQKSYLAMKLPYYQPMIAYPLAWTQGTNGPVTGEVMLVDAKDSVSLLAYRGKLRGKILVFPNSDTIQMPFKAEATRYADSDLVKMTEPAAERPRRPRPDSATLANFRNRGRFQAFLAAFCKEEGALMLLSMNIRGKDGTLFVQSWGRNAQTEPLGLLNMEITAEDYHRILRLLEAGVPVTLEGDVATHITRQDPKAYDVVGEIPGTDPNLRAQLVMLGGHLDSWHSATGATDNGAGAAVAIEAVRILKAIGVQPRRTIRIVLWSGEEEGLLGSRGYVLNHFGDPATMQLKPEQAKVSAYYNLDNGSGRIRGVYMQGNDSVRDIFAGWLKAFGDPAAQTLTIRNTGSTDHVSFDAIGIPGFQFIQDPLEYGARTHHSNMDSYDHLMPEDLEQAAAIMATFVYQTAVRDGMIPRKPLPQPRQGGMF